MTQIDYHGLKFQLLLVLKLFVICIGVAIYLIFNRPWVESYIHERYASPPKSLQPTITAFRMDQQIDEAYFQIPIEERELLFDYWMTLEPIDKRMPQILMTTDELVFMSRAERTVISGSAEQRQKALHFFELAKNPDSIKLLQRALNWSQRRKMSDLATQIRQTIGKLEDLTDNQDKKER